MIQNVHLHRIDNEGKDDLKAKNTFLEKQQ